MTTTFPVIDTSLSSPHVLPARSPGLLRLWLSSIFAFLYPPASRIWLRASVFKAALVAGVNILSAAAWTFLVLVSASLWREVNSLGALLGVFPDGRSARTAGIRTSSHWATFHDTAQLVLYKTAEAWRLTAMFEKIAMTVGLFALIAAAFLVPYFVLLPFAARPGPNKPCVSHVARTILLGSGLVHWWGAAFCLALLKLTPTLHDDYAAAISPMLYLFSGLLLWHLLVLIHVARREYRTVDDFPKPHDPWCDHCGYILIAADPAGRCPECGRLVADSLGAHMRPPTPWEARPRLSNFPVILRQLKDLVLQPRTLFFSMPTLTGQRAAQRWLAWSMLLIALVASLMVPALYIVFKSDFTPVAISGSLAMGLAWAIFGLMMVGIETAGIATFSRMRGHPGGGVYLAASAKITSYSAILMLVWVLLGGLQLITYTWWSMPNHNLRNTYHLSLRTEQILLAGSLALAHIGGLLWYELTVYRGVRAIQYANK